MPRRRTYLPFVNQGGTAQLWGFRFSGRDLCCIPLCIFLEISEESERAQKRTPISHKISNV